MQHGFHAVRSGYSIVHDYNINAQETSVEKIGRSPAALYQRQKELGSRGRALRSSSRLRFVYGHRVDHGDLEIAPGAGSCINDFISNTRKHRRGLRVHRDKAFYNFGGSLEDGRNDSWVPATAACFP